MDRRQHARGGDRRRHPRLTGGFDARWDGKSGGGPCLVGDISLGGCFAYGADAPNAGEEVAVTFELDGRPLEPTLRGRVMDVTLDPTARSEFELGFSVVFTASGAGQERAVKALMATLRQHRRTA